MKEKTMKFKRYFFLIIGFLFITFNSKGAETFKNESLNYVISYKWGLIHKESGDATLSLLNKGDYYELKLTGKTRPWADKFYQIRDTLIGKVMKDGFRPLSYTKIAHEKGKYGRDDIKYAYEGSKVKADISKYRENKNKEESLRTYNVEGILPAYDMLSVFYFLRQIDYSKLNKKEEIKSTIFSGQLAEELTVRYEGIEKIKLYDKSQTDAYHIVFKFTSGGKKKTSDDIDAWISMDSAHIPLLVIGSLPVGQVRCYYVSISK